MRQWLPFFLFAFLLRLLFAALGYNFDVQSYWIVGEGMSQGQFPYEFTHRYNYGPIWAMIVGGFYHINELFNGGIQGLHLWLSGFLALVDLAIAQLLLRSYNFRTAYIYLFAPISVLITGFHCQFDNLAILFGLLAAWEWETPKGKTWKAIVLLGLSITVKHILIFLPVWWFFSSARSRKERLSIMVFPICIFFLSLLPFLLNAGSRAGVVDHVFLYNSNQGVSVLGKFSLLISGIGNGANIDGLQSFLLFTLPFLGLLISTGWLLSKLGRNRIPEYLLCLIAFSPSMADQYLAIPMIALAIYFHSGWIKLFVISASLYLMFRSPHNIGRLPELHIDSHFFANIANYYIPQLCALFFIIQGIWLSKQTKSKRGAV